MVVYFQDIEKSGQCANNKDENCQKLFLLFVDVVFYEKACQCRQVILRSGLPSILNSAGQNAACICVSVVLSLYIGESIQNLECFALGRLVDNLAPDTWKAFQGNLLRKQFI